MLQINHKGTKRTAWLSATPKEISHAEMQRRREELFKAILLCVLCVLCGKNSSAFAADASSHHRLPNIVFLLTDDLGYGDLGCYGQKMIHTPNIDRLAAEGMRFTAHYSGSNVCAPSRCALMSGKHNGHGYIRDNRGMPADKEGQEPVPAGELQLPLTLKKLGYTLGGFGKWGLGFIGSSGDPLKQGFDRFYGYNCQSKAHNYYPTYLWDNDRKVELNNPPFASKQKLPPNTDPNAPASYAGYVGKDYAPDLISEQALKFVRQNKDRPFFLYYPTTVPHLALQVPADSLKEYEGAFPEEPYNGERGYLPHRAPRAAYAAMVSRMDREVGRIAALVKELGLDDRTIFIFSSDNGPLYKQLGGTDADFFNSAAGFHGRKGSFYEGGFRVPGIVRWHGRIQAGVTSDRVTGFEDWLPTLLELIGANDATPKGLDGISFAPTLLGRSQEPRPFLYRESPGYGGQQCVRVGQWKAIRTLLNSKPNETNAKASTFELFNLAADPGETADVSAKNPDRVKQLAEIMQQQHVTSKLFPMRALDTPTASGKNDSKAQKTETTVAKTVLVKLLCDRNDSIDAIVSLLRRNIEQRCEARVKDCGEADFIVELALQDQIGKEGFQIEDGGANVVRIVGNKARGLVYGVGKFLRASRYDQGGFTPGSWRGTSVPEKEVRGMYFATHFHNFYHDAPMEDLNRYVEDLVLWGMNNIAVWYDMHHFNGFDDPRAVDLRNRIRLIAQAAKRFEVDMSLMIIANEGYGNSPPGLRRDGSGLRTRCFLTDVCPNKPGAIDYTTANLRKLLDAFSDFNLSYFPVFAYDSGGCSCPKCRPWVINGYPKASGALSQVIKEKIPNAKVAAVTWAFTPKEWVDMDKAMLAKPADWQWADSIVSTLLVSTGGESATHASWGNHQIIDFARESHILPNDRSTPGNRPILAFARMGTHDMHPWGLIGANPSPEGCQSAWNHIKKESHGGWPYSEGIFDDINKTIFTQFHWSTDKLASETLREYVAFELSPDVVDDVCGAIQALERNHHDFRWVNGKLVNITDAPGKNGTKVGQVLPDPATDAAFETLKRVDAKLTHYARNNWRWRVLYLRGLLDSEFRKNGGQANKQCEEALRELIEIYHAQKADSMAKPPTPWKQSIKKNKTGDQKSGAILP